MHLRVFQFVDESTLGEVLHSHVYCRDDVTSVNGGKHGDIHVFVEYLAAMGESCGASQY